MEVRLLTGIKAGTVIAVEDSVGRAFLHSGKAELVVTEEVAEVQESPEKPKRRRKPAAAAAETR